MWEVVGIPEPEGRVYEALILRERATVAELAADLGMPRRRTSRILGNLVARGLVTQLPGRPYRYVGVLPDVAAPTLIAGHEAKLRRLREHADQLTAARRVTARGRHPADLIEVIEGPLNVRNVFIRLQREATREMRVFDKPPYTADQPEGNAEEYRLLDEGKVRYRKLYDRAALTEPERMAEIWSGIRRGEKARVVGSLPLKMALCDDQLALMPVTTSGNSASQANYLIHPSSLLDALSELFEALWEKSVPLNQAPVADDSLGALTASDRDLLGLLAAGTTDETIARTFGWNVRTVRRHVRRIMTLMGAHTRFQAGMEASRRGWV